MIPGFSPEMSALIEAEDKKGRRVQIHQKSGKGIWKAEIWQYSHNTWFQRANASGSDPIQALKFAITAADKKKYAE